MLLEQNFTIVTVSPNHDQDFVVPNSKDRQDHDDDHHHDKTRNNNINAKNNNINPESLLNNNISTTTTTTTTPSSTFMRGITAMNNTMPISTSTKENNSNQPFMKFKNIRIGVVYYKNIIQ